MPMILTPVEREYEAPATGGLTLVDSDGEPVFYVNFVGFSQPLTEEINHALCIAFMAALGNVVIEIPA